MTEVTFNGGCCPSCRLRLMYEEEIVRCECGAVLCESCGPCGCKNYVPPELTLERLIDERDALKAENERIRADIAQGNDDRARMAEEITRLMLIIISEGIELRAALNPKTGEGE